MVCLPCRQLKHTHGKPDSHSCLEFPLEKFRPKFHPTTIQMLALFHGMLLVARISLSASPTICHPGTAPLSNTAHTSPSPVPPNFCQRSAGCPWIARESQACSGLSSVPLSLSPSGCAHWSISISHGAFSARPVGSSQQRAWEGCGNPPWDSVTAAGLGSQSVTIKSDPHASFNILPSPEGH